MADAFVHCGDQVVIIGRHENTLRATADAIGPNCSWQRADISQCDQVEAAVNAIVARFHEIDVLINNAGYSGYERGMTSDMALDQVEEIWNEAIGAILDAPGRTDHQY
jgi:NADP-dependent 3-hydroxy acid dehydrogenase YdfG